jgi:hypothetical protein
VGVQPRDKLSDAGCEHLGRGLGCSLPGAAAGERVEVVAFRCGESQRGGQRVDDLSGGMGGAAALKERVVGGGDRR